MPEDIIDKIKGLVKKEEGFITLKIPRHLAIVTEGKTKWSKKHNVSIQEAYNKSYLIIRSTALSAIKLNIPIITFYLLGTNMKDLEQFSVLMDSLKEFFDDLAERDMIEKNKIKVSVFGKWYALPGRVVDSIKNIIDKTKDYDGFFMNFCINYDGQEEIVDAVKLLVRQIKAGKLDAESIKADVLKENMYSSYFLAPDLVIVNGDKKKIGGMFLWDSKEAEIYFTNKLWPDFDKTEFMDAIKEYQKGK